MNGWIIFVVYVIGFIPTWRRAAYVIAADICFREEPEGQDIAFGIFMGGIVACAWPVVMPGYIAYRSGLLSPGARGFLSIPKEKRIQLEMQAKEKELKERERRIAQLERETGIAA